MQEYLIKESFESRCQWTAGYRKQTTLICLFYISGYGFNRPIQVICLPQWQLYRLKNIKGKICRPLSYEEQEDSDR